MIFKRILSVSCGIMIGFLTLYILEGACFRLVETYASKRLSWAWGNYLQGSINPMLSKLGLDHFAEPPKAIVDSLSIEEQILKEDDYSSKVMSFSLPKRDRFLEYLSTIDDPLGEFDIRDFQMLRGVVTPGLKRPAMFEDVRDGLARREGDLLEFAEGFFIFLTSASSNSDYEDQFAELEKSFSFLLNNGVACLLLATESLEDLMGKISFLKASYPLLAENLVVFGRGEQASLIMEACFARPSTYRGIIVENPSRPVPMPVEDTRAWFLAIEDEVSPGNRTQNMATLSWVIKSRQSEFLYPSRLGGLLRIRKEDAEVPISSFAVAYALQCIDYFRVASILYPQSHGAQEKKPSTFKSLNRKMMTKATTSQDVKLNTPVSSFAEKIEEPTYSCEMVSEYRRIHGDDPSVKRLSNRELVLRIGRSFESMGEEVMAQIDSKDPLFMRFYLSIKELDP